MKKSKLFDFIISPQNIYTAIYSLNSYVFEKGLLNDNDLAMYNTLQDKYNFKEIDEIIDKCQDRIKEVLDSDRFFDIQVFFKMKKYTYESDEVVYRPVHTADLITQICIVSLLNIIAFDDKNGFRELSDVSELFPSNFYGNIPSSNVKNIFYDWKTKYKEYSKNVIDAYNLYEQTGEYKYEVCLDLQNFFPSINPDIVYNILLNKLQVVFQSDEEMLKKVLKKLLFFNVSNISQCHNRYYVDKYYKIYKEEDNLNYPSLGIPQGLPQAYFFGNVCMAEIAKLISKKFEGRAFYYVDDSVIYTNSENAKSENFKNVIKDLNEEINDFFKSTIKETCFENKFEHYKIKIHEEDKSTSSNMQHDKKYGRRFLKQINLGVSAVSFDIATSINELQDETIREKTQLFFDAIEQELKLIKEKINNAKDNLLEKNEVEAMNSYLKLLKRYKKFFIYRLKIINFTHHDYKDEDLEAYYEKYKVKYSKNFTKEDKKDIFDLFDEDIFAAEASLFLKFTTSDKKRNEILKKISQYEIKLANGIPENCLYYSKSLKYNTISSVPYNEYNSLNLMECEYIRKYRKYSRENLLEHVLKIIEALKKSPIDFKNQGINMEINDRFLYLGYSFRKYTQFIINNSNHFKKMVLNCLLSKQFFVDVSNKFVLLKSNNRTIEYFELRILAYLRNSSSGFEEVITFIEHIISETNRYNTHDKIDYSIMEVLNIFNTYVKDPKYIDELIITHKYIMSVWKNGSKHLYFYTLHNQEHSVELIKSTVSICKSIDFLKIKSIDYYILFLSCYLHDISMILQPNFNSFITNEYDCEILYTEWKERYKKIEEEKDDISENLLIKKFILDCYKNVDSYFESEVRSKHAKNSANFIKTTNDLDYIDSSIRSVIANVSEAHGFDENDVYGLKSKGQSEAINVKFLMILLRLADLMDMSKDRVSLNIMKLNIEQMSKISQFHWISHAAIDTCNIQSKYSYNQLEKYDEIKTYLDRSFFNEVIEVHLYLNTQNLMSIENQKKCSGVEYTLSETRDWISLKMLNKIGDKTPKCDGKCNFMCKWMCEKNNYLINELQAINKYLSRNQDNNFNTEICLKIHMQNTRVISQKYLDTVFEYIK